MIIIIAIIVKITNTYQVPYTIYYTSKNDRKTPQPAATSKHIREGGQCQPCASNTGRIIHGILHQAPTPFWTVPLGQWYYNCTGCSI